MGSVPGMGSIMSLWRWQWPTIRIGLHREALTSRFGMQRPRESNSAPLPPSAPEPEQGARGLTITGLEQRAGKEESEHVEGVSDGYTRACE